MKVKSMSSFGRVVVLLFGIFILWTFAAYYFRDSLLLNSALVVATILMAGFVAYQALATFVMAQQAQEQLKQMMRQVELTQQSIEEMRKEREFFLMREHTIKIRNEVIKPLFDEFRNLRSDYTSLVFIKEEKQGMFPRREHITSEWEPGKVNPILFKDLLQNHAESLKQLYDQFKDLLKQLETEKNLEVKMKLLEKLEKIRDSILKELKKLEAMELLQGKCEFISGED